MEEDVRNLKSDAQVTGEEMAHQAHQHKESLADRAMNLGSDAGHATADGSHGLAAGIHNAVVGAAQQAEHGIANLFHHGHTAPTHEAGTPPPAPHENLASSSDTPAGESGGGQSTV